MEFFYNYGVDIICVLTFIGAVINGRQRGFVKMILSIAAFFISVFVAREFFESVGTWIYDNFLEKAALDFITRRIEDSGINFGTSPISEFAASLPESLTKIADSFGTSIEGILTIAKEKGVTNQDIAQLLVDKVLAVLLRSAANILGFMLVFLASNAVLSILIGVVNKVFKLPVLKGINRLLGAALGGVKGVAQVVIFVLILSVISGFSPKSNFAKAINGSQIAQKVSTLDIFEDFEFAKGEGII